MVTKLVNDYNICKKTRKPKTEENLYENILKIFEKLQEPKNRTELYVSLESSFNFVNEIIQQQMIAGNIIMLDINPNKYMLTSKGRVVLYKIQKLNEFITTWESDIVLPKDKAGRR